MENLPPKILNLPHKKTGVYTEYILWSAMPESERLTLGISDQKTFAAKYKVHESTLSNWKKRGDFDQRVDALVKMWARDRTPTVIMGIYKSAVGGNSQSQRLWLEYFHDHSQKLEVTSTTKVELSPNDLRFIIDGFPEPDRTKFYGYLRDIIDFANALRRARQLDDEPAPEQYDEPEEPLLEQADHDAPNVPEQKGDALAESDPASLRCDMVWQILAHYHEGAARWRQE